MLVTGENLAQGAVGFRVAEFIANLVCVCMYIQIYIYIYIYIYNSMYFSFITHLLLS